MTKSVTWQNFQQHYLDLPELGMALEYISNECSG